MGEKTTRARALAVAEKFLTPRKETFAALAAAAEHAHSDADIRERAERDAARLLERGRRRAAAVMVKARQDAAAARRRGKSDIAERMETWRRAYGEARAAGWTAEELTQAGQPEPLRGNKPQQRRSPHSRDKANSASTPETTRVKRTPPPPPTRPTPGNETDSHDGVDEAESAPEVGS